MSKRSKWSLLGIADHMGVMHVGGRIGAERGPVFFRKAFERLHGKDGVHETLMDRGDLTPRQREIEARHRQAADSARDSHLASGLSVVVGGGHDHGYSHLLGIFEALRKTNPKLKLGCINIDAHLDVRKPSPLITSGSPFYLALESGLLSPEHFIEFGIQQHCNKPELWSYVQGKKVEVMHFEELRKDPVGAFKSALKKLTKSCDAVVVDLDLDAVAAAFAPGVSAPQAEGFTPSEIFQMMDIAGKEPKVPSLGIFELNPEHDIEERTAILAATAAYHYIAAALDSRT